MYASWLFSLFTIKEIIDSIVFTLAILAGEKTLKALTNLNKPTLKKIGIFI